IGWVCAIFQEYGTARTEAACKFRDNSTDFERSAILYSKIKNWSLASGHLDTAIHNLNVASLFGRSCFATFFQLFGLNDIMVVAKHAGYTQHNIATYSPPQAIPRIA